MGQRSQFETYYDCDTIVIGTQSGNNATVASAAFDVTGSDEQAIMLETEDWNASDTVAGGFVTYGLMHGDDTVVGNAEDVPDSLLTVTADATSTVTGAQDSGVFARVEKDDTAAVVKTTYLGSKRYLFLKRVSQTNIANGFAHCVSLIKGGLSTAPVGYKSNES